MTDFSYVSFNRYCSYGDRRYPFGDRRFFVSDWRRIFGERRWIFSAFSQLFFNSGLVICQSFSILLLFFPLKYGFFLSLFWVEFADYIICFRTIFGYCYQSGHCFFQISSRTSLLDRFFNGVTRGSDSASLLGSLFDELFFTWIFIGIGDLQCKWISCFWLIRLYGPWIDENEPVDEWFLEGLVLVSLLYRNGSIKTVHPVVSFSSLLRHS